MKQNHQKWPFQQWSQPLKTQKPTEKKQKNHVKATSMETGKEAN